jgi:hypothetical protein
MRRRCRHCGGEAGREACEELTDEVFDEADEGG